MTEPLPPTRHPSTETAAGVMRLGSKYAQPRGKSKNGITEGQWVKVREAWSYEWPDTKASDYAGITIGKLRMAYNKDPELRNKRDLLKLQGRFLAQKNVVDHLEQGDIQTTRWFLERRDQNYSNKSQVDVNITHSLNEAQIIERLSKFIDVGLLDAAEPAQIEGQ
jgi:hypothetical protein